MSTAVTKKLEISPTKVTQMFAAFVRGDAVSVIAEVHGVPLHVVQRIAVEDDWDTLARTAESDPEIAIREQKARNAEMWTSLRRAFMGVLRDLEAGTYEVETIVKTKEGALRISKRPSPSDLQAIANTAKIIAEGTARLVGDRSGDSGSGGDGSGQKIEIHLPGIAVNLAHDGRPIIDVQNGPDSGSRSISAPSS